MKKASEVTKSLFRDKCPHTGNKFSQSNCFDCLSSAIREQVREALEEAQLRAELVDCAGLSAYEVSARIVTAIRKLAQEIL